MSINVKPLSKHLATLTLSIMLVACGGTETETETEETTDGGGGESTTETGIGGSPLFGLVGDSDQDCNTGEGEDNDSYDSDWSNNCYIKVDPTDDEVNETFAESFYSEGIQRVLWCLGHDQSPENTGPFIDKEFGPRTRAALESFQAYHGLVDDGVVGPLTWEALQNVLVIVGSDDYSLALSIEDQFQTDAAGIYPLPFYENDCFDQPAFWEYLVPEIDTKTFTLTDKDENDFTDESFFGQTEEKIFGNTFN